MCYLIVSIPDLCTLTYLDGQASDPVLVLSGEPQWSFLGPILFLIFINDLPDKIRSSVRLLADDCVLYMSIYSIQDCLTMQEDFTSLRQWEVDWQMKFNVAKCHLMRLTWHQHHKVIRPMIGYRPCSPRGNFGDYNFLILLYIYMPQNETC